MQVHEIQAEHGHSTRQQAAFGTFDAHSPAMLAPAGDRQYQQSRAAHAAAVQRAETLQDSGVVLGYN